MNFFKDQILQVHWIFFFHCRSIKRSVCADATSWQRALYVITYRKNCSAVFMVSSKWVLKVQRNLKIVNFFFEKLIHFSKHYTVLYLGESKNYFYTCNKQVLWESAGAFFPRDNSLISRGKSHISRVRALVVRCLCLLFNPEIPCSNPWVCAYFFKYSEAEGSLFSAL